MPTLEDQIRAAFERVAAQTLVNSAPSFKMLDRIPVQFSDKETTMIDLEAPSHTDGHRKAPKRVLAAGLLAAAAVVAIALVTIRDDDPESPAGPPSTELRPVTAPPVANGLIAYVGEGADATSDIYVMAPDGSGVRRLTATSELTEYAPAWSADGSRLAFVRTADTFHLSSPLCEPTCQLVIVDPSTGVETFAVNIPQLSGASRGTRLPTSLAWSPVAQAIVIMWHACSEGGCGPKGSIEADLETGAFTLNTPPHREEGWVPGLSPDGSRIAYFGGEDRPGLKDVWVKNADNSNKRQVALSLMPPEWSPDSSLLLASDYRGWFTVRPDGTDRTELGIRDHTPSSPLPELISSGIDWQPAFAPQQ